ncbi:Rha family transcriptional regulator [Pseudoduganella sp. FT26W]|uniref:Rha family transcriptional regulator n=1 Tax=Duganella aquatilis TaxID=2666082 RepID=A0A844CX64_9BURK|nr:Cro/CI family transcriptional regulator [Duganella aquatilis]MRW85387.1 Rha family transcriptional regulator [Duganella aquatilis]
MNTPVTDAIVKFGNNKLAATLGVSPQAVSKWAKNGQVPPRRALAASAVLGLSPWLLCPGVFGPATTTKETP